MYIHVINGNSPHPRSILMHFQKCINHKIISFGNTRFNNVVKKYGNLENICLVNLICKAIYFRFNTKLNNYILHGHSAGKIGLFCYLTSLKFTLTIYGSEVYQSNYFSRILLRIILNRTIKIHVYSFYMKKYIIDNLGIEEYKIEVINPGIDINIFSPRHNIKYDNKINFFISRRSTELYHTFDILQCFININKKYTNIKIFVLEGNSDNVYFNKIRKLIEYYDFIEIIEGFINPLEMSKYFEICDYSISFPDSDEISATVLQSIALGCIPILNINTNFVYKDINYVYFSSLNNFEKLIVDLLTHRNTKYKRIDLINYAKNFDINLSKIKFQNFFN